MNVNLLWKQRIERDLNSKMVDEDFIKLLSEYEKSSRITRKRAREISRKLIGVYPDQVISWFNYKTWLSMKYLPNSNVLKESHKTPKNSHSSVMPETNNNTAIQLFSILYQNLLNQSLYLHRNSVDNFNFPQDGDVDRSYQNLIMLANVADSVKYEK